MSDTWSLVTQRFGFLRNVLSKQLIHSSTRNYSFFLPKIQSLLKPAFYVASCSVVGLWSDKAPKRQGKYIVWPRIAGLMKKNKEIFKRCPSQIEAKCEMCHTVTKAYIFLKWDWGRDAERVAISQFAQKPEECVGLRDITPIPAPEFLPGSSAHQPCKTQLRAKAEGEGWNCYPSAVSFWRVCPPLWKTWRCDLRTRWWPRFSLLRKTKEKQTVFDEDRHISSESEL